MSNRQYSLTVKAIEIIDAVPKRTRSKFVSDAVVNYAKKKDILDEYIIQNITATTKQKDKKNKVTVSENKNTVKQSIKKGVKIDNDF